MATRSRLLQLIAAKNLADSEIAKARAQGQRGAEIGTSFGNAAMQTIKSGTAAAQAGLAYADSKIKDEANDIALRYSGAVGDLEPGKVADAEVPQYQQPGITKYVPVVTPVVDNGNGSDNTNAQAQVVKPEAPFRLEPKQFIKGNKFAQPLVGTDPLAPAMVEAPVVESPVIETSVDNPTPLPARDPKLIKPAVSGPDMLRTPLRPIVGASPDDPLHLKVYRQTPQQLAHDLAMQDEADRPKNGLFDFFTGSSRDEARRAAEAKMAGQISAQRDKVEKQTDSLFNRNLLSAKAMHENALALAGPAGKDMTKQLAAIATAAMAPVAHDLNSRLSISSTPDEVARVQAEKMAAGRMALKQAGVDVDDPKNKQLVAAALSMGDAESSKGVEKQKMDTKIVDDFESTFDLGRRMEENAKLRRSSGFKPSTLMKVKNELDALKLPFNIDSIGSAIRAIELKLGLTPAQTEYLRHTAALNNEIVKRMNGGFNVTDGDAKRLTAAAMDPSMDNDNYDAALNSIKRDMYIRAKNNFNNYKNSFVFPVGMDTRFDGLNVEPGKNLSGDQTIGQRHNMGTGADVVVNEVDNILTNGGKAAMSTVSGTVAPVVGAVNDAIKSVQESPTGEKISTAYNNITDAFTMLGQKMAEDARPISLSPRVKGTEAAPKPVELLVSDNVKKEFNNLFRNFPPEKANRIITGIAKSLAEKNRANPAASPEEQTAQNDKLIMDLVNTTNKLNAGKKLPSINATTTDPDGKIPSPAERAKSKSYKTIIPVVDKLPLDAPEMAVLKAKINGLTNEMQMDIAIEISKAIQASPKMTDLSKGKVVRDVLARRGIK